MAKIMKMESIVERAMSNWLNELYISGFDKITILRVFPIRPTVPVNYIRDNVRKMLAFVSKLTVMNYIATRLEKGMTHYTYLIQVHVYFLTSSGE